jgi:hypothetical protein
MAPKLLRPTAGSAWRQPRTEGYVKQLPSGNVARLRPVSPDQLLTTGEVPDILTPLVVRMLFEGADGSELSQLSDPSAVVQNAGATVQLFNTICRLAFVEPRIVADPQGDDEISINDVPLLDRGFVFQLVTQPAEVLRDFMFPESGTVAAVPDGEGDGEPTVGPDDDSGPVGGAPV